MTEPLRIALAGLGTVGAGVIKLLTTNHDLVTRRAGREIQIVAVSARDRGRGWTISAHSPPTRMLMWSSS
jgi:homoserine dehydrogenase